ncbi:S-adenosyl-L-methionine-dependent methyltransferase [Trametes cingulata]|nr:S-adenosyl-L-methionine-dependent methyltransferase [Trametes cingulata]
MSQDASAHAHAHAHHHHGHGHGHDYVQANKAYFDEHADKVEEEHPESRQVACNSVDAMREAYPAIFDKDRTEVLDFACGTGMVSEALFPYVKRIVGVDISEKSVEVYNKKAAEKGASERMKAVCVELKGEPGELDGAKFDLITCCAAYHHFPSIADTTRVLASFLKPGGSLLVTDLMQAPDKAELVPLKYHDMVPHKHGLSEEDMRAAFEGAGLTGFEMGEAHTTETRQWGKMRWFLARGVKPVEGA